jgi:hypothetical protein
MPSAAPHYLSDKRLLRNIFGRQIVSTIMMKQMWPFALGDLSRQEENWDGYEAPPIPKKVIHHAYDLLVFLERFSHLCDISPCGSGEILLTWMGSRTNYGTRELDVYVGEGKLSMLIVDDTNIPEEDPDYKEYDEATREELKELLESMPL